MQRLFLYLALAALVATNVSCGKVVRAGRGSSFLVIDTMGPPVNSNVAATSSTDMGHALMRVVMKDAGAEFPVPPSPINQITITRYRVVYTRSDGRNTAGVDVPHPFDGVVTVTVLPGRQSGVPFQLVRRQAKDEPPLVLLRNVFSGIITEFATVTFYGADQGGNEVSVTGTVEINFGNF